MRIESFERSNRGRERMVRIAKAVVSHRLIRESSSVFPVGEAAFRSLHHSDHIRLLVGAVHLRFCG